MKKILTIATLIAFGFNGCATLSYSKSKRVKHHNTPKVKSHHLAPKKSTKFTQVGIASYYGQKYDGRQTANGEILDLNRLTAAHKTLPFGTLVRVTALDSGRSVVVKINDRGPFVSGRIIDLTDSAAKKIGIYTKGIARVKIETLN